MEEKEKQIEYINKVDVTLTAIEVETNPNNQEEVTRLKFNTDKGFITWKPKKQKSEYRNGLNILKIVPYTIDSLPSKLLTIAKVIQEKGNIRLNVSYTLMTVEKDGFDKEYRFFTSEKIFDTWEILPEVTNESVRG